MLEMTKGMWPPEEDAENAPAPLAPMQTVVWVHDGPVCVTIIDVPPPRRKSAVCHCDACEGASGPDRGVRFF